ncbi:MAG: hypothetical protein H0W41_09440 [Chloroflexi bacterium]|nr:hypothetical protein [Chloroflexota bacterium]
MKRRIPRRRSPGGSGVSSWALAAPVAFRIFQDIECVSLLLGDDVIDWKDPRVTFLLNEYTRRINRAHQRLDDFAAGELIGLAYASFEAVRASPSGGGHRRRCRGLRTSTARPVARPAGTR